MTAEGGNWQNPPPPKKKNREREGGWPEYFPHAWSGFSRCSTILMLLVLEALVVTLIPPSYFTFWFRSTLKKRRGEISQIKTVNLNFKKKNT